MIFVVKVATNKEEQVAEMMAERVKKKGLAVLSIVRPHGLRGYIIVEAEDRENVAEAILNLQYVKGIMKHTVSYEEIKGMLEPISPTIAIEKGDIVEIISEPFKREKAKVLRVDKTKEEVVVELLEAVVPIPITVKLDNVRVIRREKEEKEK